MFPYLLKVKKDKHAYCDSQYLCKGPHTRAVLRTLNNNIWETLISYLGRVLAAWTQRQPSLPVLIPPVSEEPVLPGTAFPQWHDVGWVPSSLGNQVEASCPWPPFQTS